MTSLALWMSTVLALGPSGPVHLGPARTSPATRVVTLAPSLTELVLALGGEKTLVGVSRFDERPEVAALPRMGGFVDPNIEAILAARPELVLVQPGPGNQGPVQKLSQLGISVLAVPLHSVEDVVAAYGAVGTALGMKREAQQRLAALQRARSEVRAKSRGQPKKRVLIVYGFSPLVVAGPGSFADDLLPDIGATNAAEAAKTPFASYSVEAVLAGRPDVVLDCSNDVLGAQAFRTLPGMEKLPWHTPSKDLMHPGPALERALPELFKIVHPPR
jgi:iron complex transport system substrate-binding protein